MTRIARSTTPVQAALARPMPKGLAAAVEKARAATSALESTRSAKDEFMQRKVAAYSETAEAELAKAIGRRDVAKIVGDDDLADLDAEVDRLQALRNEAEIMRLSRHALISGLATEVERRREVAEGANTELGRLLADWVAPVLAAADEHLAEAVNLVAEARLSVAALKPLNGTHQPLALPRVVEAGYHHGPDRIVVPEDIDAAVQCWHRGFRSALR